MAYKDVTNFNSPNYTKGRQGNRISGITIHWWGDPNNNPTFEGVVSWLCNPRAGASAHYVVTGTGRRCACIISPKDTAWHAGNWAANLTNIGIECDPRCRDEDYDVVAEVVADLWRFYGKLPLYPHRHWCSTRCPGNYDIGRIQRLAEMKLNPPKPAHKPQAKPKSAPVPKAEKLPTPIKFKTKLEPTNVWDLTSNPNYKAAKKLNKNSLFTAYAQIKFNNQVYYVTEYSYNKGLKNGVNARDLEAFKTSPIMPTPAEKERNDKVIADFREEMKRQHDEQIKISKENNSLLKTIAGFLAGLFKGFKK